MSVTKQDRNSSLQGSKIDHIAKVSETTNRQLTNTLNRVDLLTDVKIGDMKGLMKDLADQILKLSKRLVTTEIDVYKKEYDGIPVDVMALTKTEL